MTDTTITKEGRFAKLQREKPWLIWFIGIAILTLVVGGSAYLYVVSKRVYIDKSSLDATTVDLSPTLPGILQAIYVKEGDSIPANTVVARVGNEIIKTKTLSLVMTVSNNEGQLINPGESVVTVIDPNDLRVVGEVDEDKGLADIHVGEHAVFTVDTFGGKKYEGIVDEISPTSVASGIAFNISNKRETKQFNVKVRFDTTQYTELKNGMSAKLWIYKDSNQ